jgi:hypothetical protein
MIMSKKVYVKPNNHATIMCDCGKTKTLDMSQFQKKITEVKVTCTCGQTFTSEFDYRQRYRKEVNLYGIVTLSNNRTCDIHIHDVSMSGVGFEIIYKENMLNLGDNIGFELGDYINIRFRLDDVHKSQVDRTVVVRRIIDNQIGAEFCDNITDKKLGFYLLP